MSQITDFYPLDFLQWIELPNDDHYAEPVFQMFPKQISRKEAAHFWALRKRAFALHGHHPFTTDIRASASFAADEADVAVQAAKRNVSVSDAQLAYRELVERWETIVAWRKAELAELAQKEEKQQQRQRQQAKERLSEEEKKTVPSPTGNPKDKNASERATYNQDIQQVEEALDTLNRVRQAFTEKNDQFLGELRSLMRESEELAVPTGTYDSREASYEQAISAELQHVLSSHVTYQEEALEESGRKEKNGKEVQLEHLYQERNALEW